ncbi:hypothetical protein JZ751_030006 [Albula glossodonta]|uniref:Dynein assembly factor 1, axonemal n=1 Tax=Albula glossodonta TaxID=121402 RepID=A0A8T2NKQ4_9TELE|nr:hypothetical protein JZ751_030006 [Albula glossodonta]
MQPKECDPEELEAAEVEVVCLQQTENPEIQQQENQESGKQGEDVPSGNLETPESEEDSSTGQSKEEVKRPDEVNGNVQPTQLDKKENMGPRITKKFLRDHCKKNKLYITPHLNDTLYLHFKGFSSIENLEEYTGLKCLWLECNGLQRIQNLEAQTELRCLFLHQNLIQRLENLDALTKLSSLNLCNNYIRVIENIFLEAMPELRVLNLMGNDVIKKIPNYRKTMIIRIRQLTYLDDRPVFPKDRACAEAWGIGGLEAERKEREMWETRERKKIQDSLDALRSIRDQAMERHRLWEEEERRASISESSPEEETQDGSRSTEDATKQKTQAFVEDVLQAHEEFLEAVNPAKAEKAKTEQDTNSQNPPAHSSAEIQAQPNDSLEAQIKWDLQTWMNATEGNQSISETNTQTQLIATQGSLVTELENADHIETIHIDNISQMCINDLPDLEDVDSEDVDGIDFLTSQHVFQPKIEVISGASDDSGSEEMEDPMAGKPLIEESVFEPKAMENQGQEPTQLFYRVSDRPLSIKSELLEPTTPITEEESESGDTTQLGNTVPGLLNSPKQPSLDTGPEKPRCLIEELD